MSISPTAMRSKDVVLISGSSLVDCSDVFEGWSLEEFELITMNEEIAVITITRKRGICSFLEDVFG